LNIGSPTCGCDRDTELPPFVPDDATLPYFAYGLFKPGEPLYRYIQDVVDGTPTSATVSGSLRVRDGLPLLKVHSHGAVSGNVVRFAPGRGDSAYAEIGKREPRKHYRWEVAGLADPPSLRVNLLVGRRPDKGSVDYESGEWCSARDALLRDGLLLVSSMTEKHSSAPFRSAPPESFEWERFFTLQMTYLFLWTVIERYAALAYGPELRPGQTAAKLGEDRLFWTLLEETVHRTHQLVDTQDPDTTYRLDSANPRKSALYYFQVRNNLTHRGKGAWQDAETVRQSLRELQTIMRQMIERTPGLGQDRE
jgi:hypothetical protein